MVNMTLVWLAFVGIGLFILVFIYYVMFTIKTRSVFVPIFEVSNFQVRLRCIGGASIYADGSIVVNLYKPLYYKDVAKIFGNASIRVISSDMDSKIIKFEVLNFNRFLKE